MTTDLEQVALECPDADFVEDIDGECAELIMSDTTFDGTKVTLKGDEGELTFTLNDVNDAVKLLNWRVAGGRAFKVRVQFITPGKEST